MPKKYHDLEELETTLDQYNLSIDPYDLKMAEKAVYQGQIIKIKKNCLYNGNGQKIADLVRSV